jgi:hypothetical protein
MAYSGGRKGTNEVDAGVVSYMKIRMGFACLALAGAVIAEEPIEVIQSRHNSMEKKSAWRKCQVSDLVGLATLVKIAPAQTNEVGVEAVFRFTDRMPVVFVPNYRHKGGDDFGEYVVTIPSTLRNPEDTTWNLNYLSLPWKWKESETYVCFFRGQYAGGSATYSMLWVLPGRQWEMVREEVQKEQAEYEPYVRAKKRELRDLKEEYRAIWGRIDITEADADALSKEPRIRNNALRKELKYWEKETGITVEWGNLKSVWP